MSEQQIEEIELSIKQSKDAVAMRNSALKLFKNKDFKKVITEGYFEREASRLVLLKSDPSLQSEEHQKDIDRAIIAIGRLRQYLSVLVQLGNMAEQSIRDSEEAMEEILAENVY